MVLKSTFQHPIVDLLFVFYYILNMNELIIGREAEQQQLQNAYESNESQLVIIYGRRPRWAPSCRSRRLRPLACRYASRALRSLRLCRRCG